MRRLPSLQEIVSKLRREITWKRALLLVILTMNLRTFEFFPHFRPLEEVWFLLCLVAFVSLYPLLKARTDWTFSPLELQLLGMMVVLIIIPALSSYSVFGQPLAYGLLARRSSILVVTWLLLRQGLKYQWLNTNDIEVVLIFLTWSVAVLFVSMRVFINPNTYQDAPLGFILGLGTEDMAFSAPGHLFPFGTIYYALRGIREGKLLYYLLAVIIFSVGAGSSWRALFLSLSITILFFLFRWKRLSEAVGMLSRFAVLALTLIVLLNVAKPGLVGDAVDHLKAAFSVALGGEKQGNDASADARVQQVETAIPYVKAHPIFGVGALSGQWNGGPEVVLGTYFSDSDIGLLGMLFTFGAVGVIWCAAQYLFALRLAMTSTRQNSLVDAAQGYLLFTALFSVSTGFFIVNVEQTTLFLVLLEILGKGAQDVSARTSFRSDPLMFDRALT